MKRRCILFLLIASMVCGYMAARPEQIPSCGVCVAGLHACFDTPGVRINLLVDDPQQIDGAASSFVRHGLAGALQSRFEDQDAQSICEFYREVMSITLTVNGTSVPSDGFDISLHSSDEGPRWAPTYYFLFPAGTLTPGIYVLTGTFDVNGIPCHLMDDPEELAADPAWRMEDGKLYGHLVHTIILTVL